MTKRAIIQLNGSNTIFRISRKGVDVDSAGPADFLIHENYLIGQPFYSQFITCPFAGYTGGDPKDETVQVTIPNVTSDPIPIIYTRYAGNQNFFPARFSTGMTGSQNSENRFDIYTTVVSSTRIDIRFIKLASSVTSPAGVLLTVYRRAI